MTEIKDGAYGFVSGTVGRSFTTKNGRAFELEVKDPKQQYPDKWTIWGDLVVAEGDRASIKGWLSISRETYEKDGQTKVAIRRAVNKPELAAHEQGQRSAYAPQQAPVQQDTWAGGGNNDADTPF